MLPRRPAGKQNKNSIEASEGKMFKSEMCKTAEKGGKPWKPRHIKQWYTWVRGVRVDWWETQKFCLTPYTEVAGVPNQAPDTRHWWRCQGSLHAMKLAKLANFDVLGTSRSKIWQKFAFSGSKMTKIDPKRTEICQLLIPPGDSLFSVQNQFLKGNPGRCYLIWVIEFTGWWLSWWGIRHLHIPPVQQGNDQFWGVESLLAVFQTLRQHICTLDVRSNHLKFALHP